MKHLLITALFAFGLIFSEAHAQATQSPLLIKLANSLEAGKINRYELTYKCSKELRDCNAFYIGNMGGRTNMSYYIDTNAFPNTIYGLLLDLKLSKSFMAVINSNRQTLEISYFQGSSSTYDWGTDFRFLSIRDKNTKQTLYIDL